MVHGPVAFAEIGIKIDPCALRHPLSFRFERTFGHRRACIKPGVYQSLQTALHRANRVRMLEPDYADIRDAVRALCADFPVPTGGSDCADGISDRVCRRADQKRVSGGAHSGGVRRIGPAAFSRCAIRKKCSAPGATGSACHAQMYTMGTLRATAATSRRRGICPHRPRRAASAGLRGDRAGQRHRHAFAAHVRAARRRHLFHQRPESVDQPRRAFGPHDPAGAHHAQGRSWRASPTGFRYSSWIWQTR